MGLRIEGGNMLKNIVFDIGNVILKFDPLNYLLKEFDSIDDINFLYEKVFKSKEWTDLDRGIITNKEGAERLSTRENIPFEEVLKILENWPKTALIPIESTLEFIKHLKNSGRYKLYLLSNFPKEGFSYVEKNHAFIKYFDGKIISSDYLQLKPEREIYESLLNEFKLIGEETVFIDDRKENIDGAQALGISGIWYRDSNDLLDIFNI